MNTKALKTLEYNKIVEKLCEFAVSPMGKEKSKTLLPSSDMSEITVSQKETSDAVGMSLRKGNIPLGGIRDIRVQIKRVSVGGILSIEELLNVGEFLYVCKKAKDYSYNENKNETYESLDSFFEAIQTVNHLEREISRCILSETEISDDASEELRKVRREIKIANDKVREQLNSIINSSAYKNMLQENVVTIRNDRYCVPVKSEYRNAFNGMVHDQSNTGSTLFIEPFSVVQLNNRIKELQVKEKEEIDKILKHLSEMVFENIEIISMNLEILAHLDFVFAKAKLSISMNGTQPLFNLKGYINIKKARHPLLNKDTVVPIDVYLGKEFNTLLITGPNTGGKTVVLKTLGLFTLMGQAGLHIPAFDNSQLGIFDNVFADIGDEQSIEQSLSTFSSHMTNIVSILDNVSDNSLVLFDELGAGTDPTEGAALAMSIIEYLRKRNIRTAVTTHYSELKVYALSTEAVTNASCEFDVETLRPTYRLLIGIPGKSNAFAISKRLGLQDYIIEDAKAFLSRESVKFEDVITDLEVSKKTVIFEQERAEQYRKEAEKLKKEIEEQKNKTQTQKEKIILEAKNEAKIIYQQAKEDADRIIKEINKAAKEKAGQAKLNESRLKIKNKLSNVQEEISKYSARKIVKKRPPENLYPGDRVYIMSFDQRGIVVSAPDANKEVMVQTGIMKIKVPIYELTLDEYAEEEKDTKKSTISSKVRGNKSQYISAEIDCRGQLVDEALGNVDKYIDDAFLAGLKQVMIIHGKGTGALRTAIWQFLSKNPHVKSHRPGKYGEGEMGVTVVELK